MISIIIFSGGQTGVDRAALDVAIEQNIEHRGWCPKGRKAEDGVIPSRYQLIETESDDYRIRTRLNIENSDATLILYHGILEGGTKYTYDHAIKINKPVFLVDMVESDLNLPFIGWLKENKIETLNIAGPRESKNPGIYHQAKVWLNEVFDRFLNS